MVRLSALRERGAQGDPGRLRQILINLAGNSVKFTDKGSVDVYAQSKGEYVIVTIKDTGIGISESVLPHIFDEFQDN